jgi:uncharacterized membrane protein
MILIVMMFLFLLSFFIYRCGCVKKENGLVAARSDSNRENWGFHSAAAAAGGLWSFQLGDTKLT